jgi:hypothetical protein
MHDMLQEAAINAMAMGPAILLQSMQIDEIQSALRKLDRRCDF